MLVFLLGDRFLFVVPVRKHNEGEHSCEVRSLRFLHSSDYFAKIGSSILLDKVIQVCAASLVHPLLLEWLERQLVEFSHKSEAGSLVEEVEFLVVFVRICVHLILVCEIFLVNNQRSLNDRLVRYLFFLI